MQLCLYVDELAQVTRYPISAFCRRNAGWLRTDKIDSINPIKISIEIKPSIKKIAKLVKPACTPAQNARW